MPCSMQSQESSHIASRIQNSEVVIDFHSDLLQRSSMGSMKALCAYPREVIECCIPKVSLATDWINSLS